MKNLTLIFPLLFVFSCSIDRTILEISENEGAVLANFQELPSKSILKITDKNEPGEKLLLCLTYIDEESKESMPNQLVKFYHTSTNGNYEQTDPNDESTARLSGKAFTDDKGRIYIETMEQVLGNAQKIIMDNNGKQGVVPYLPLNELKPAAGASTSKAQ